MFFGLVQGAVVVIASFGLLVAPAALIAAAPKRSQSGRGFSPTEVLRNPCFWVLYVMFVLVAAGGLAIIPNVKPIVKDLGLSKTPVTIIGITMAAGAFALILQRIFDGIGRPFFGWISDHIGRENTMAIAFVIGAIALFTLTQNGAVPIVFVLVSALYFGVFGEIYSLFPATQGDTFGAKFAAANAGMLYTAKGAASLLVPFATKLGVSHGWNTVFAIAMTFNLIAAALGLFVLKPMRARHFAAVRAGAVSQPLAGGTVPASGH
jgi:MFS transporter, OFA family, oxalate/formate antiporter